MNDYIRLYEIPVKEEGIEGSILGFGCGSRIDTKNSNVQFVLSNHVGRPNSIIYDKGNFKKVIKSAKEILEKDFKVVVEMCD